MKTEIKNYLIWIVIILLVANLSAFITVFVSIKKIPRDKPAFNSRNFIKWPDKMRGGLVEQLNFDEKQMEEFKAIRNEHQKNVGGIYKQMHDLRINIVNELSQEKADTNIIDSLAVQFGKYQTELKKEVFKHFVDIKNICNEQQLKTLMMHINYVVDRNSPGPGDFRGMQRGGAHWNNNRN